MVLDKAAPLLAPKPALVVVVWEPGVPYELFAIPHDVTPAPLHVDVAVQLDRAVYEGAQRLAQQGAELAKKVGFEATGLAGGGEANRGGTARAPAQQRRGPGRPLGARRRR